MSKNGKASSFPQLNQLKRTTIDLDALLGVKKEKENLYADWAEVDAGIVSNLVWAASEMGGTIQFGRTKNCYAYTIKLYVGKPYDPIYFDGNDEGRASMAEMAVALVEALAGHSNP